MIDKISCTNVAYEVSRATLLPLYMEREKNCSYDALIQSIFQSSAFIFMYYFPSMLVVFPLQIMQKASAGFEKAKDNERELKKEITSAQKRAERAKKKNVA